MLASRDFTADCWELLNKIGFSEYFNIVPIFTHLSKTATAVGISSCFGFSSLVFIKFYSTNFTVNLVMREYQSVSVIILWWNDIIVG